MSETDADSPRALLDAHVGRTVTGRVEDPAVLAAVVGIERLVVALDSTDVDRILAALDDEVDDDHVRAVAEDVREQVAEGIENRMLGEKVDAASVNPDAGGYEIVTDADLVRAGVRAAQRSYDAMPYYRVRYGDRGSRFASTDSGWLIAMAAHDEEHTVRQVRWLSRVLANRGMPTWLLENHVHQLVAEVRSVAPDAVGSLPAAAEALASTRREHVSDDLLALADGWADEALGDDLPVARTGWLLAAATADVLAGVVRTDAPLVEWLTDPERATAHTTTVVAGLRSRIRTAAGAPAEAGGEG